MAFCQVLLGRDLVKLVNENPLDLDWWGDKVSEHSRICPSDPLPTPCLPPTEIWIRIATILCPRNTYGMARCTETCSDTARCRA